MNRTRNIALFICVLFLLPIAGRAQINLILNPQFEQYRTCPDEWDEAKYCDNWTGLDTVWNPPDWAHAPYGIPDYENTCSSIIYTAVPNNFFFNHTARSGNGMMQVNMYDPDADTANARDYLQGKLASTLVSGHRYYVNFYASLTQVASFAVNNLGAYFDDGTIDTTHHPGAVQSCCTPQVLDTSIITDTLNWKAVNGILAASGSEKYITIGNFFSKAHTLHTSPSNSWSVRLLSYYLIDDVSVIDCANEPHAGNDTLIYASDSAWLGPHENLLPYTWYKLGSTTPIDSGGGIWVKPTVTTTYILKQKLCGLTKYDTMKVRVWPDTVTEVGSWQFTIGSLRVYPNPVVGELTIECAGCFVPRNDFEVRMFDVVGRDVLHAVLTSEKERLEITSLDKGIYFVEIVKRATGEKVVKRLLKE